MAKVTAEEIIALSRYKRPRKSSYINRIFEAIGEYGPMTRAEIAEAIDVDSKSFGSTLSLLIRDDRVLSPQRLHVIRYKHEFSGARIYPRAVYALGPGRNCAKPKPKTAQERTQKYYRKAAQAPISSVFELGIGARQKITLTQRRRGLPGSPLNGRPNSPGFGTSDS